jgi:CheY-like chemotaxis protein
MRILFLDDMEDRHRVIAAQARAAGHELVPVETAAEAIAILERGEAWDLVCLDHDLNSEHMLRYMNGATELNPKGDGTGYDVACWLEARYPKGTPCPIGSVIVHSINPEGRSRMLRALRFVQFRDGRMAQGLPFGSWGLGPVVGGKVKA